MISNTDIQNNLSRLEALYRGTGDAQLQQFYSKLAMIEFGGWIEESIDILLSDYLDNHILDVHFRTMVDQIIKKNYGFDYDKNLFKLFCVIVGADNWETIMSLIGPLDSVNFESITSQYSSLRNSVAHTHTMGTTATYTAPSVILSAYGSLWTAMQNIENHIQLLR